MIVLVKFILRNSARSIDKMEESIPSGGVLSEGGIGCLLKAEGHFSLKDGDLMTPPTLQIINIRRVPAK